jgi:hypothetical protein
MTGLDVTTILSNFLGSGSGYVNQQTINNSLHGNTLANIIAQLMHGRNFDANRDFTTGAITNILAQSQLGAMFGFDDPRVFTDATKLLSVHNHGMINGAYSRNQLRYQEGLKNLVDLTHHKRSGAIFGLSQSDTAELAYQMRDSFKTEDWNELLTPNKNIDETKIGKAFESAKVSLNACKKILKMSGNIASMIDTVNAIGGGRSIEENTKTFNKLLGSMINAGLDTSQQQRIIQATTMYQNRFQEMGYSQLHASQMARSAAYSGIEAMRLNRDFGLNLNVKEIQNIAAEQMALEGETLEGRTLAIATAAGEYKIKDKKTREAYMKEIRDARGDESKINEIAQKYGVNYQSFKDDVADASTREITEMIDHQSMMDNMGEGMKDLIYERNKDAMIKNIQGKFIGEEGDRALLEKYINDPKAFKSLSKEEQQHVLDAAQRGGVFKGFIQNVSRYTGSMSDKEANAVIGGAISRRIDEKIRTGNQAQALIENAEATSYRDENGIEAGITKNIDKNDFKKGWIEIYKEQRKAEFGEKDQVTDDQAEKAYNEFLKAHSTKNGLESTVIYGKDKAYTYNSMTGEYREVDTKKQNELREEEQKKKTEEELNKLKKTLTELFTPFWESFLNFMRQYKGELTGDKPNS